jgi:hypothetical protein
MFVIPKIEGNSKIGSSVFSQIGKQSNCKFHMFVPTYEEQKIIIERNKVESDYQ